MIQFAVLKKLWQYTSPYKGLITLALLSAIISTVLSLWMPVLIGQSIDNITDADHVNFAAIGPLLLLLAATILGMGVFQWAVRVCSNLLALQATRSIRIDVFDRLNRTTLRMIDGTPHGDIMETVVTDIEQISEGLLQGVSQLLIGSMTIVGTLVFMLSIHPRMALLVIVLTPISLIVSGLIGKWSHKQFKRQSEIRGALGGYIQEMMQGQRLIQAFGYQKRAQSRFEQMNAELYDCGVKAQFYAALANPATRFVNGLIYAAVAILGALKVITGGLSVGTLSSFLLYANQYNKPFHEITSILNQLQAAFASAQRVFCLLDLPFEEDNPMAHPLSPSACTGEVSLHQVDFSYHPSTPMIQHLNLRAEPGQRIAIVGTTGSGKTTLINLLMRFYDVDNGQIRVSNQPIRTVMRDSLRRCFGMVLQETWLFSGTIRDNIAYGRPDATDAEIYAAAKQAHAHSFIQKLELGYDTILSHSGEGLSQGQKQLLCIARVMLSRPKIFILDEATSSIDTRTELKISQAFAQMTAGHTSFIVAHRLSTIQTADLIVVMHQGEIVEQGTHPQLLAKHSFYHKLYNSQFDPS